MLANLSRFPGPDGPGYWLPAFGLRKIRKEFSFVSP
jgi:hypothetical protein